MARRRPTHVRAGRDSAQEPPSPIGQSARSSHDLKTHEPKGVFDLPGASRNDPVQNYTLGEGSSEQLRSDTLASAPTILSNLVESQRTCSATTKSVLSLIPAPAFGQIARVSAIVTPDKPTGGMGPNILLSMPCSQ